MRAGARLWWGLPVLVALLWAAGALTVQGIPGLPTPPEIVVTSLPFVRFLRDIASFLAIGALLVGGLLLPDRRIRGWAVGWSIAWLAATALLGVLTVSEIRAAGIDEALGPDSLWPFLTDAVIGRVLIGQLAAAAAVAVIAWATGNRRWMWVALVIALAGVSVTGLLGHGGLGGGHEAASVSLMLHIASISLWVGGLAVVIAAALANPQSMAHLLPKFSVVALWCVIVAAETGLLNASMRVATASALVGTWYGSLVLGKAVLLGWLVLLGWRQRREVVGRLEASPRLLLAKFAGWELVLMGTAIAVSVTLARIGPATAVPGAFSPVALALITVLAPVLISAAWTPRGRLADWLRSYPEVPSLLLAIGIVEIAGVDLTTKLLGIELGTAIGALLLLALGWAWSIAARGRRGSTALAVMMAAWPLAAWAAARFSGIDTGVRAFILGVVLVEAVLVALLVLRARAARLTAPPAEAAMAG